MESPGSPKCRIDLQEAKGVLASLSLTSVTFGSYLLAMRSECDVVIAGEPYVALMLWLNLDTGQFIARVWNQTVSTGSAAGLESFVEACENHFSRGRPCLGCPEEDEGESAMQDFVVSQTPVPRRIAKACHRQELAVVFLGLIFDALHCI